MNEFTFSYPTKVYFGQDSLEKALQMELDKYGKTVMLAYGRETPKCSGTIAKVKEFPKNVERKVRHGVKNWLDKEDEE